MMVADSAGECAAFDGFPEGIAGIVFTEPRGDDTALRAVKGLVRRSGYDVRTLTKWFLEMGPHQSKNVRHVIHQEAIEAQFIDEPPHLGYGLRMQHHALAEDDEFRLVLCE